MKPKQRGYTGDCEVCRFFRYANHNAGMCKRRAPVLKDGDDRGSFPWMHPGDSCGDGEYHIVNEPGRADIINADLLGALEEIKSLCSCDTNPFYNIADEAIAKARGVEGDDKS